MAWLDELKAGDAVAIRSGFGYADYSLAVVERLTPTQLVVRGSKYRRDTGRAIGESSYIRTVLTEPTEEIRTTIRKAFLVAKLRQVAWEKAGIETLEQVYTIAKNGQHLT